jgi:hypothetical protein
MNLFRYHTNDSFAWKMDGWINNWLWRIIQTIFLAQLMVYICDIVFSTQFYRGIVDRDLQLDFWEWFLFCDCFCCVWISFCFDIVDLFFWDYPSQYSFEFWELIWFDLIWFEKWRRASETDGERERERRQGEEDTHTTQNHFPLISQNKNTALVTALPFIFYRYGAESIEFDNSSTWTHPSHLPVSSWS